MCHEIHVGREIVDAQAEREHIRHQHRLRLARDLHSEGTQRISITDGQKSQYSLVHIPLALCEPRQQTVDDGLRHAGKLRLQCFLVIDGARGVAECHHGGDVYYDLPGKPSTATFSAERYQLTDLFSATSVPGIKGAGVD